MSLSDFTLCTQVAVSVPVFVWHFGPDTLWNPLFYKPVSVLMLVIGVPVGIVLDVLLSPVRLLKMLCN